MSRITNSHVFATLSHWVNLLTRHYAINPVDHVGPMAGSLLERRSWDHN
jgi:hypothetical protein